MRRQHYSLTAVERNTFETLPPQMGKAMEFWAGVALSRRLDPATVISDGPSFTALPLGHRKHWCFPIPLRCKTRPIYREKEA